MPSIDSALFNLLGPSSVLEKFAPSRLLSERIEFVEPKLKDNFMEQLRTKYTPVNGSSSTQNGQKCSSNGNTQGEYYCRNKVELKWRQKKNIGCGLVNPANTCYLNSTLQCLLYTPPLINYLQKDHAKHCRTNGFCVACSLSSLYDTVHIANRGPCRPSAFIHNLKMIAKHFNFGRQEDAHEFLVHLRDRMIQQFLQSVGKSENCRKDTTPVHAVFGGRLVSTVTCSQCNNQSNTPETFLALSLDVRHSESVQQSFGKLCKKELLSGANSYKCEKCKRPVIATKQFRIQDTPNVLVLHLKRFQFGNFIGKLKNIIRYPDKLDISQWTKQKAGQGGTRYTLYGVLVHSGSSANCGHYYCYVKSHTGAWHCMNDTSVNTVGLNRVLNSEAYLLFYVRSSEDEGKGAGPSNGHPVTSTNGHSNGVTNGHKSKLLETNPFFSTSSPSTSKGLNSGRSGLKFTISNGSGNKLIQNPYLSTKQPKPSDEKKFIGPLLPDAASKPVNGHSNGVTNGASSKTDSPVISCASSLSSLDILKSTYQDSDSASDGSGHKPNAQPVLTVKKKDSSSSSKPKNVFDSIKSPINSKQEEKKPRNVQDVFEKLSVRSNIKSWDGGSSKTFENKSSSWNGNNKRQRDTYDEDLDRGKTKKVKQKHHRKGDKDAFQRCYEKNRRPHDHTQSHRNSWDGRSHKRKKERG